MVFFNYSTMQMAAKVVYYGPGLCGKTTNLQYIFEHTSNDSRGEMVSLATETDRTLFFDLLPIDVGSIAGFSTRIQLYTVPGQVFYNTTRKLVLKGVDGVVFVADSQKPMLQANIESFQNLEENLAEMGLSLETIPLVLQYNKRDLPNVLSVEELNEGLNPEGRWQWQEASALNGDGVFATLKTISKATLLALKKRLTKGRSESSANKRTPAAPAKAAPAAPKRVPAPPAAMGGPTLLDSEEVTGPVTTRRDSTPLAGPAPQTPAAPQPAAPQAPAAPQQAAPQAPAAPGPAAPAEEMPEVTLEPSEVEIEIEPPDIEIEPPPSFDLDLPAPDLDSEPVEAVATAATVTQQEVSVDASAGTPGAPQSGAPQPGAPQPGAPQSGAPQPGAPEPAAPEPAAPEPAAPQPAAPQPAAPQPATPAFKDSQTASQAPDGAPRPRKAKKSRASVGGLDALAELEKLRKQTLRPKKASNGREIQRELELSLSPDDLSKAKRFSLKVQLEDADHRLLDQAKEFHVDLDTAESLDQVLLNLRIALHASS